MKSSLRNSALPIALLALVLSSTGWAEAAREAVVSKLKASTKPGSVVRLDRRGKIPQRVIPKVKRAARADKLGRRRAAAYIDRCTNDTVDMGTWCVMTATYSLDRDQIGRNDYFFAVQACADHGGYLPSAGELVAAAAKIKLVSTIDDSELTASIDEDRTDGLEDRREMSSTLVTVSAGSTASGSLGVTLGSKGDPKTGEPDPVPEPRDPAPSTLQYVTVFDNHDEGGFAGSKPVGAPESFRCAFNKAQRGAAVEIE
jgi:hypothetical protein